MESRVATHAKDKVYIDKLFSIGMQAKEAIALYGKENVIDASMGVIADDNGNLICLPTVEEQFRSIPIQEAISYSPVGGLPGYLDAVVKHTFGDSRPDAYISAIASAGGAGAIANAIWNYSNAGDMILTHDWYWTPYNTICKEIGRNLETFSFLDSEMKFNLNSFASKVRTLLEKQDYLVIILNSPNNNPTGYSISESEWDEILDSIIENSYNSSKTITLLIDIAYIDYTKDPISSRLFLKKFSKLPSNVLINIAFSMSKGFTVYGQRTGALIGVSSNKHVIKEFENVNLVTSRARWSNVNRGCMKILDNIYKDQKLIKKVNDEREIYNLLIKDRADVFIKDAYEIGLKILPYDSGFFITIPCEKPTIISDLLITEKIYVAPISNGIRVAACSVPAMKMNGLAQKINQAFIKSNFK